MQVLTDTFVMVITADIDECLIGTDLCEQICSNTVGSYECSCTDGYNESGFNCIGKIGRSLSSQTNYVHYVLERTHPYNLTCSVRV